MIALSSRTFQKAACLGIAENRFSLAVPLQMPPGEVGDVCQVAADGRPVTLFQVEPRPPQPISPIRTRPAVGYPVDRVYERPLHGARPSKYEQLIIFYAS